jgi:membrane protein required for colicin V production
MTLADWIIVVVLAAAVLGGMSRGFFRSAFSLGGLVIGLMLAAWNYGRLARIVLRFVHNPEVANAIAFLVIALLVMAVAAVAGEMLAKIFQKVGLGCLDRLAGAVFGFFEGALLVTVCILVTLAFFPKAQWLTGAKLPPYFYGACHVSTHITPSGLAERVRQELRRIETESPPWMHPTKGQ